MKAKWEKLMDTIGEFSGDLSNLLSEIGTRSPKLYKESLKISRKWDEMSKHIEEFDTYISPVKSMLVQMPSASKEFAEIWQFYKEYLNEQFGIYMRSRYEIKSLELLWDIADKNSETAIAILNHTMAKGYPRFFKFTSTPESKIDEKQDYDHIFQKINQD